MTLTIVNPSPRYPKVTRRESAPYGYIYVGVTVAPPRRAPFVRGSARRVQVLDALKALATRLEQVDAVVKATVYRAVLMPPVPGAPRFDVVVLVETIDDVRGSAAYERLIEAGREARVKLVGDVDKTRQGLFLFNHFTAEDPEVASELWDHLAAARPRSVWSTTRWDHGSARFAAHQFSKPSFLTFVRANLRKTVSMPVLYKLA